MKTEAKVGLLFLVTIALVVAFAYFLGALNPFSSSRSLFLTFNFAGGIEVGSKVRLMGIPVGKVKNIEFHPGMKDEAGSEVNLKMEITVSDQAWSSVKSDSRFYINLAGVIGEKFIEISPGAADLPVLKAGAVLRGEDPPRIDQLISQSYGLAGKILDFVEENEGSVSETIEMLNQLVTNVNRLVPNLNKLLAQVEKTTQSKKLNRLMSHMEQITGDIASVSGRLRSEEAGKTIDLLHELVWRLDELDKQAIKEFLQEEGVRAKIF